MIFPGMDPYLEDARLWPGVHASLIVYARDSLQPMLMPRYVAAVEERVFLEGSDANRSPDVWIRRREKKAKGTVAVLEPLECDEPIEVTVAGGEVRETYITILDRYSEQKVVTVIEIVSPTNKHAGPGQDSYVTKQREILSSHVHLVEIDLLRAGRHVLAVAEWAARNQGPYDYLTSVNRAIDAREKFDLYPRTLRQSLPKIRVPLAGSDPDVRLDVQAILERTYEQGCYGDRLAYDKPCRPPLSREDLSWADRLLARAKRRRAPRNSKTKRSRKKT
jgi:hypothetical protein